MSKKKQLAYKGFDTDHNGNLCCQGKQYKVGEIAEVWRDIAGYEGSYQVSNYGRVLSFNTNSIKKNVLNHQGYYVVSLYKNGKEKYHQVSRLVAGAFLENPNNYQIVHHKDFDRTNNHVSNLEYCSSKTNSEYTTKSKRYPKTSMQVPVLRSDGKMYRTMKAAADDIGADPSGIKYAISGDNRTCKGYSFKMVERENIAIAGM